MRIAIITSDDREEYKDYARPAPFFGTAPAALLQGFERLTEHEVHVVACTMQPMNSPGKLAPNIWFHSLHVPKIGWLRTGYQGCIRSVRRQLEQIQPDIVHGQGTERYCALTAALSGFPSVITIHGNMRLVAKVNRAKPFSFHWITARLEALTIPRARGVVCITSYTRSAVQSLAQRTWVLPNAVDQSFFEIRRAIPGNLPPKVLCVGAVCLRKNQNNFIRALDLIIQRQPLEVVFLGTAQAGDPYAEEFRQLVAGRSWCRHAGFANREELKKQLSEAALLVLPSLEDNCPMVLLEAFAAGRSHRRRGRGRGSRPGDPRAQWDSI